MRLGVFFATLLWASPVWATYQVILGSNTALPTAATQYAHPWGSSFNATENARDSLVAATGQLLALRVVLSAAPQNGAGSQTYSITVRLNGADTALGCTITEDETSCTDNANVAVSAAAEMGVEATPANTPAAANAQWAILFDSTTVNQQTYGGGNNGNFDNAATSFGAPHGVFTDSATEVDFEMLFPIAGTIDHLFAEIEGAAGTGNSYDFTTRLCNPTCADTTQTCQIAGASATTCNNGTDVSVAAGDRITIETTPTSTPTAQAGYFGIRFIPTTPNKFILALTDTASLNTAATAYHTVHRVGSAGWTTTEANAQGLALFPMVFTDMAVKLSAAPDLGVGVQDYTFTLRVDGADQTGLQVVISESSTTGSDTGSIVVGTGQEPDTECTPTLLPTAADGYVSYGVIMGSKSVLVMGE